MKIGIVGCTGRMGQQLLKEVLASEHQLCFASTQSGHPLVGSDVNQAIHYPEATNITIIDTLSVTELDACDAVIDFTQPDYTAELALLCAEHGVIHVIGTTGLTTTQEDTLKDCATRTPIVYASNMSIGVNILNLLTRQVASVLDDSYDIEIVEMHHNKKIDSPSGTALTLGQYAAEGRNVSLEHTATKSRDGQIGARPRGEIGFATLRGGDVVGEHTVIFATEGERIELTHKASDRSIFAKGALRACRWASNKKPGLYSMEDVVGSTSLT